VGATVAWSTTVRRRPSRGRGRRLSACQARRPCATAVRRVLATPSARPPARSARGTDRRHCAPPCLHRAGPAPVPALASDRPSCAAVPAAGCAMGRPRVPADPPAPTGSGPVRGVRVPPGRRGRPGPQGRALRTRSRALRDDQAPSFGPAALHRCDRWRRLQRVPAWAWFRVQVQVRASLPVTPARRPQGTRPEVPWQ
jgi:hypothetical protein